MDVKREDFFDSFARLLLEDPDTTSLVKVENALVPILQVVHAGIDFDFNFCSLQMPMVPDSIDLRNDDLLRLLTETDVKALNGTRVTDRILQCVPDVPVFRVALRAIKFWGKQRGLYSFKLGFMNGVTYAMLTAKICQHFPSASASTIVHQFFELYSQDRKSVV